MGQQLLVTADQDSAEYSKVDRDPFISADLQTVKELEVCVCAFAKRFTTRVACVCGSRDRFVELTVRRGRAGLRGGVESKPSTQPSFRKRMNESLLLRKVLGQKRRRVLAIQTTKQERPVAPRLLHHAPSQRHRRPTELKTQSPQKNSINPISATRTNGFRQQTASL